MEVDSKGATVPIFQLQHEQRNTRAKNISLDSKSSLLIKDTSLVRNKTVTVGFDVNQAWAQAQRLGLNFRLAVK